MPRTLPDPEYPAEAAVRRVRTTGEIKWNGALVYVSQTLAGEHVAIEETEKGQWTLRFYDHQIGIIDKKHLKLSRRTNPNL